MQKVHKLRSSQKVDSLLAARLQAAIDLLLLKIETRPGRQLVSGENVVKLVLIY